MFIAAPILPSAALYDGGLNAWWTPFVYVGASAVVLVVVIVQAVRYFRGTGSRTPDPFGPPRPREPKPGEQQQQPSDDDAGTNP